MKNPDAILASLTDAALLALATAIQAGWVAGSSPESVFTSIVGEHGSVIAQWLNELEDQSFTAPQAARLLKAVVDGRHRDQSLVPDLVVSGPDVAGVPTADTQAVVQSLFQEAESEIILAGYAFYNGKLLFERLAERMKQRHGLRVIFHVDVPRRSGDTTSDDAIVLRYADEFKKRHWPWDQAPEIYYDPRALSTESHIRASLHAKVVVVDKSKLFLTSANFTEAAQQRNIEMGVFIRTPYIAEQIVSYFEGLRNSGQLARLPMK